MTVTHRSNPYHGRPLAWRAALSRQSEPSCAGENAGSNLHFAPVVRSRLRVGGTSLLL